MKTNNHKSKFKTLNQIIVDTLAKADWYDNDYQTQEAYVQKFNTILKEVFSFNLDRSRIRKLEEEHNGDISKISIDLVIKDTIECEHTYIIMNNFMGEYIARLILTLPDQGRDELTNQLSQNNINEEKLLEIENDYSELMGSTIQ